MIKRADFVLLVTFGCHTWILSNLCLQEEAAGVGDSLEEGGEGEAKDTVSVNSSLLDTSELDEKVRCATDECTLIYIC